MVVAAALAVLPGMAAAQGTSQEQAAVTVASDTLVGTKVFDNQGKEIGSIDKLLIDPRDGRVASVLIKEGGTAGMGGKEMSLPWSALKIQRGEKGLVATMQQPGLDRVPSASPSSGRPDQPPQQRR
jgi:sporulation protein YlmC with PRC-barrel domain